MLEEFSLVLELIASIAVIGSLIYLAREVSQNTEMMRVGASQSWTDMNFDLSGPAALDREVGELWVKGDSEFESLDEVDQVRLIMYEWRAIEAWHHLFELHQRGILPQSQWDKLEWIVTNIGQRQAVQASWKRFRSAYEPAYQEFIDTHLGH